MMIYSSSANHFPTELLAGSATAGWRRLEFFSATIIISGFTSAVGGRQREPEGRPMPPPHGSREGRG